jgi:rifampicin phosphotransferase
MQTLWHTSGWLMSAYVVTLAEAQPDIDLLGGKAASLAKLTASGLRVPRGFVITTRAYREFVTHNQLQPHIVAAARAATDEPASLEQAAQTIRTLFEQGALPDEIAAEIDRAYASLGARELAVAVRSSATAEDLPDLSFAGQQETYLNVRGDGPVRNAVQRCWASLWTARAIGYRARSGISPDDVALAVVVQELVAADAAGVMFTANPLSGARDEAVINAAWGLGEAIVSGLVTPDTLVVDKKTGAIQHEVIADKSVMTVRSAEGTTEAEVPRERRKHAVLTPDQAAALARTGTEIERLYGQPMDIEWAMHAGTLAILQARPITAMPETAAAVEWRLPRTNGRYARSSVMELLPDPVSPLFATLGLPGWNAAMQRLLGDLGLPRIMADEGIVTINDYAYYDLTLGLRQSAGVVVRLPKVMASLRRLLGSARERWADEARPRYAALVERWHNVDLSTASPAELLAGVRDLVKAAAEYYLTIQSGILPAAYMSEALFSELYQRVLRRPGDPPALTFLLGYDSEPIRAEKSLYDLAAWARTNPALASYLVRTPSADIADDLQRDDVVDGWGDFRRRFKAHLHAFGHAIYDLDFAKPLPTDEPAPVFEALKFFVGGQATNPYERQEAATRDRQQATQALDTRLRGPFRALFRGTLRRAQRFAPLREDALADVGLGWPLVRRMLLELGRRLVESGVLESADDVFWLRLPELKVALDNATGDLRPHVARRRAHWAAERKATPPSALPIKGGARYLGIDFSAFMPARTEQAPGNLIRGIGASPGTITATARVIGGPDSFDRMQPGDVLVARITTPAWTPLFALASGVVTDVGGPLSHSSIVAREYHIPAVLGTGVATERIASGQHVTVDGDAGTVLLGQRDDR